MYMETPILSSGIIASNCEQFSSSDSCANTSDDTFHTLNDMWTLWAHLPHDTDWSIKSYKQICTIKSVEQAIMVYENMPDKLVENCMLFLMRDGINPMWEDEKNKTGGCFSYKIPNKDVLTIWKNMSYMLIGEKLSENTGLMQCINGITISPKKHFCVVKLWISSCEFQNPAAITDSFGLQHSGCLFKKHVPTC